MVFGAFCGAGLALRDGRLVSIDLIPDLLPKPATLAIRWLGVALMAIFMAVVLWLGAEFAAFSWRNQTMSTGMSRGIPISPSPSAAACSSSIWRFLPAATCAARFIRLRTPATKANRARRWATR